MTEAGHPSETMAPDRTNAFRAALLRFLDSGHDFGPEERDLRYKHHFINTVFFVCWVLVSCFGLWRLLVDKSVLVGAIDLGFGALALTMLITLRRTEKSIAEPMSTVLLGLSLLLFTSVYLLINDAVRSGPFLLITASAFFLKGVRAGVWWTVACSVVLVIVEMLPPPYAKGTYGTLTSLLDITCLTLLLYLYETQKRQANMDLAANEEKFRTLFDSSIDAIFVIDETGICQQSRGAQAMFRAPEEAFQRRSLADFQPPDAEPEAIDQLRLAERAASAGRTQTLELRLRRHDGTEFWANIRFSPIRIGGKPMVQAIVRNIDPRKRSEQELEHHREELEQRVRDRTQRLEESENRFARLLELTEEGIFLHEKGIIVDATNTFCRLTGYVRQEVIGRDFIELMIPPERRPFVRDYIAAQSSFKYELVIQRADGKRIEVEAFGRSVDLPGRPLRAGVWRDITPRKETERMLRMAQQSAEEANRAKSAFIANMSHEIRTPLNAIVNITRQLQRELPEGKTAERLARVESASSHLHRVLSEILDISRIEANKLKLELLPFDFRDLLSNVNSIVRDAAEHKGLDFRILADERIPRILLGDPTRLTQILLNLTSNAVKFTERGSVNLWVSAASIDDAQARLRFRVTDTGIGMTEEQCSRLFRDFEQASAAISRQYGGSGLGLSISRRLLELMGSEIAVHSEPGHGSEFSFELTLGIGRADEHALSPLAPSAETASAATIRAAHGGTRILLVEDSTINQEVALDFLDDAGLVTDVVDNGRSAIERVTGGAYSLVLMDVQMPVMDGLAATRSIRQIPGCETLPIIAMTAFAYPEDRAHCLEAGMDDYLAKPLNATVLFACIDRWLTRSTASPHALCSPPAAAAAPDCASRSPAPTMPVQDVSEEAARRRIADLAALPAFSGLPGVLIAAGRPLRYLALLDQFVEQHGDDGGRVLAMLENGGPAHQLAHTLKGVASSLGLEPLASLAGKTCDAIAAGDSSRNELACSLRDALHDVVRAASSKGPGQSV